MGPRKRRILVFFQLGKELAVWVLTEIVGVKGNISRNPRPCGRCKIAAGVCAIGSVFVGIAVKIVERVKAVVLLGILNDGGVDIGPGHLEPADHILVPLFLSRYFIAKRRGDRHNLLVWGYFLRVEQILCFSFPRGFGWRWRLLSHRPHTSCQQNEQPQK